MRLLPFAFLLLIAFTTMPALAQDRLKAMPGYERFQRISRESTDAFKSGALSVTWTNGGAAFDYPKDGKRFRYDIAARAMTELVASTNTTNSTRRSAGRDEPRPLRGRQYTSAKSPDGKFIARYHDRNVWLRSTNNTNEFAITTEGSEKTRVKLGTATWVYGEELFQSTAMWWSSNSQKFAFYRFDESRVPDFYLQLNQTKLRSTADIEPYAKAGATNPAVDIFVYDLETKRIARVDVRSGKPFDNDVVGHYVYGVSWSRDGELLFHRTNRRQNIMELCAANPDTGKCRVIVREEWAPSWTENSPAMRFLKDGRRFIWTSERNGWANLYLYDLSGKLLATLTDNSSFEAASIVRVDEDDSVLYYMARDGDNPMKLQLHRVGVDGKNDRRLTDPEFHHTVDVAPDGKHFIDIAQTHDAPPVTRLMTTDGKFIAELAKSDVTKFNQLGLTRVELFKFKAADGETDLYGLLHFPSNFRPDVKHPLLVSVYAGPATTGARETFTMPNVLTEFGFLVATLDSRSASGRGKRFLDSIYLKLGQTEIDDQAAGVKFLAKRRYVDRKRVGIFGTSYGGTASVTCLLRYPDVFRAACSSSPVTDYRNYDTIYTERYMWLPQENNSGYDAASVMTHVKNLKGRLLLYYGTADDNVHPNNSMQLIQALQRAGKSFDVQVGPDQGHGSVNRDRMMEFFIENLVLK
ncbi:MAG TPA: DPP IV N-terminal domain-containing protein [Candidatus Limnocylindria bacterium]|nr:DPP IV N-terminal domain-containing protein [Candidatus Limnocylindria bacterium]